MSIDEEQKWKERDYERFVQSERLITHRPKWPIPRDAVLKIIADGEEIFGSQSTEEKHPGKVIVDTRN